MTAARPPLRRVLVTGGAGFIGSHVVDRLLADGAAVVVLDDLSTGRRANLPTGAGVTMVEGDVADPAAVERAIDGCAAVVHLAAVASVQRSVEDPLGTHRANLVGTLCVLEASKRHGVERIVYASSAAVYGDAAPLPVSEDAPLDPRTPYAIDKLAGEHYLRAYASSSDLSTVALRFFNVYGPRQRSDSPYSGVISLFVDRVAKGESVDIFGDGRQTRDFVAVADVVDAIVRSLHVSVPDRSVVANVGTGSGTDLLELLAAIAEVAGQDPQPPRFGPARTGDVRHSRADVARLPSLLGRWTPRGLRDGLRALVNVPRGGL